MCGGLQSSRWCSDDHRLLWALCLVKEPRGRCSDCGIKVSAWVPWFWHLLLLPSLSLGAHTNHWIFCVLHGFLWSGGAQGMFKDWPKACRELWTTVEAGGCLGIPWCKVHTPQSIFACHAEVFSCLHVMDGLMYGCFLMACSCWGFCMSEMEDLARPFVASMNGLLVLVD